MGLDRLVLLLEASGARKPSRPALFIATFDGPMRDEALVLVTTLRNAGFTVDFDPRGGKMKRQIERALKVGARFFGAYGDSEHASQKLVLKNLDLPDSAENKLEVALAALPAWLAGL
jgi:histidyl-tRNA synthetase